MGVTLTGENVKVYVNEREWSGGSFKVYSIGISSKDKDGNWNNGFLDVQFKKSATDITNKCKINIKNAFPVITESNGKKYTKWFINDYELAEANQTDNIVSADEFMKIPDGIEDELPFK